MGRGFQERTAVQEPLIRYAQDLGWGLVPRDEALTLRRGEGGTLFPEVLRRQLLKLNPGVVTEGNADGIVARIEGARSTIEGNAEVMAWIRGRRTVFVPGEKRHRNITVVDFEHADRNVFHVTREWEYTNGQHTNRADVMFLVNGIPAVFVETKSPTGTIEEGVVQARRYHVETPELMTHPQVFVTTKLTDFVYGPTWNLDRKALVRWKEGENFEDKVRRFLAPDHVLYLLRDGVVFFKKDDELTKVVLREHQARAVGKVVERAADPERRRGLVWHTQGSGKTLTMMAAARLILSNPALEKPTVVMLVDRNELESQLFSNLQAYGLEAEVATSKRRLRALFEADYRGLIVSMIHKFEEADAGLCTRSNVVVLVDEAHRSTSGDLGNYLEGALPNATLIGFTGTPIAKTALGKGTFKVFGADDPRRGYLDKYSIVESQEDGTTLPLNYTLAPNAIRVPRKRLEEEFLKLTEAEGVADVEDLNRILDRAVKLKNFLKARDRVEKVVEFVAKHFRENVEPQGYKAFLVGVDREACAFMKKALDRHLPREWSEVVYTGSNDDEPLLKEFHRSDKEELAIRKRFVKAGENPKILIVTEKLLTGYDAPILYCMYLDKPMRDHALLQAIARVNRPYEDDKGREKKVGLIVDFVGIFERLERALAFDSDVVESVVQDLDLLKERFAALMRKEAAPYLALCKGSMDDKATERAINRFADASARESFYGFCRDLQDLYEIISPDLSLRPFLEDYRTLMALYATVRASISIREDLSGDLAKKTDNLIREQIESLGFGGTLSIVPINEKALKALKEEGGQTPARVISLARSLAKMVEERRSEQPFLIPIGDRAAALLEKYDSRQTDTREAVGKLRKLVTEFLDARRDQEESGLSPGAFTILKALKQEGVDGAEGMVPEIEKRLRAYPNHRVNPAEARQLKAELYGVLMPAVGKEKMVDLVGRILSWVPS